jgi:uncharacterized iron-regulated protein
MKYTKTLLPFLIIFVLFAFKSDKPAYKLFNIKGKEVKYSALISEASKADVVFFGELHDNPIAHWLQKELTRDLYAKNNGKLVLGAEMLEADNQWALDQYLIDSIDSDTLAKKARLWPNFDTDYKPLVDFAKEKKLPFIATNIPRKYASQVYKKGIESLDTLSSQIKAWMVPLPMEYDGEVACYKNIMAMMGPDAAGHMNENLPKAQAIKDATMAWFIQKNFVKGSQFIHYNGSGHSDNFEGIIWYLKRYRPELKILTITTVEQDTIQKMKKESKGVADFVVVVPSTMTKTY